MHGETTVFSIGCLSSKIFKFCAAGRHLDLEQGQCDIHANPTPVAQRIAPLGWRERLAWRDRIEDTARAFHRAGAEFQQSWDLRMSESASTFRARIHRGSQQIGGTCVELEAAFCVILDIISILEI